MQATRPTLLLRSDDGATTLEIETDGERITALRMVYRGGRYEMNWTPDRGFSYYTWHDGGSMLKGSVASFDGGDFPRSDEVESLRGVARADAPEALRALELLSALAVERARRRALTAPKEPSTTADFIWFESSSLDRPFGQSIGF